MTVLLKVCPQITSTSNIGLCLFLQTFFFITVTTPIASAVLRHRRSPCSMSSLFLFCFLMHSCRFTCERVSGDALSVTYFRGTTYRSELQVSVNEWRVTTPITFACRRRCLPAVLEAEASLCVQQHCYVFSVMWQERPCELCCLVSSAPRRHRRPTRC